MKEYQKTLCKAKTLQGEWKEGYPVMFPSGGVILHVFEGPEDHNVKTYQVDPKTLCRYAGFLDQAAKRVFQNDLLYDGLRTHIMTWRYWGNPGWYIYTTSKDYPEHDKRVYRDLITLGLCVKDGDYEYTEGDQTWNGLPAVSLKGLVSTQEYVVIGNILDHKPTQWV